MSLNLIRISHVLLLILVLLPVLNAQAKPSSSLAVTMEWVNTPVIGQINEFRVVVLSGISSENLQLEIHLPDQVEMIGSEAVSTVNVKRGIPYELKFKVFISEKASGSILAKASIGKKGQAFYSASNVLIINLNDSPALKSRSNVTKKYRQTERNGVGIREYQLSN